MVKLPEDTLYRICDSADCSKCRPKPDMIYLGGYYFCSADCTMKEKFNAVFEKENAE